MFRVARNEQATSKRRRKCGLFGSRIVENFSGIERLDFGERDSAWERTDLESSGIDVQKRDRDGRAVTGKSGKARIGIRSLRDERSGSDDPDDLPFDERPSVRFRHLLANRDFLPGPDEFLEVWSDGMIRDARHRNGSLRIPTRERNIKYLRRFLCIVEEHFIEIPHPEEQEAIGVFVLPMEILLQHRG